MNNTAHQCDAIPAGIRIEPGSGYLGADTQWVLVVSREATEADLEENNYLEDVGDEIWTTAVQIACCPYCGERLGHLNEREDAFAHFDCSGWMAVRR